MTQFTDDKHERLSNSGFTNTREWLLSATQWEIGDPAHTNDLWAEFLSQRGFDGQHNDALALYVSSLGYNLSDALQDNLAAFWADTDTPLPTPLP